MIKINLLPYHEKQKKENVSRQITIIVGLFAIFILALIWVYLNFSSQVASLESRVAESRQTLQALNEKIGDLEKFKKQKALLELKLDVIGNLEENRLLPVKTFDDLAMLVPSNEIWVIKIDQSGANLRIEGVGRDNIAAANFMKTIENFALIKSVDLISSKKVEIAGVTLQQFIFACKMRKGF
jgi:Tfp pilus assembly protein PilN